MSLDVAHPDGLIRQTHVFLLDWPADALINVDSQFKVVVPQVQLPLQKHIVQLHLLRYLVDAAFESQQWDDLLVAGMPLRLEWQWTVQT
jgi:hypothetical protein